MYRYTEYGRGLSWSLSYGTWIHNYLCNQCLSPLTLWVPFLLRRGVLDTTLCDRVCKWLAASRWFTPVSSTNKTDSHDINKILLKVMLKPLTLTPQSMVNFEKEYYPVIYGELWQGQLIYFSKCSYYPVGCSNYYYIHTGW